MLSELLFFLHLCLEGKVAANQKQATHIVVSTSLDAKVEGCDTKQHLVSGEVCLQNLFILICYDGKNTVIITRNYTISSGFGSLYS